MTSSIVIDAHQLSKRYFISNEVKHGSYKSLRDTIASGAGRLTSKVVGRGERGKASPGREEFWALNNVSFKVAKGDVVGIIGRNGAGKSTLLKILSRITEPTAGRVTIGGRVASLLEVGTGFHPELTGRENIFLNGAILGMQRSEIRRKFDEIVEFAEVHRFLDTPVKRFSSGMYIRLAFAVAAHLEPEILVVDEVLAVGDADFQRKCLGKMSEVAGGGRTVLFVSHNLSAVEALCNRAIFLSEGSVVQDGPTAEVVSTYLGRRNPLLKKGGAKAGAKLELLAIEIAPNEVRTRESAEIALRFRAVSPGQLRECALLVHTITGLRVALIDLREFQFVPTAFAKGEFKFVIRVENLSLSEGDYAVGTYVVTDDFAGDLLEITELHVASKRIQQDFAPYSASARGLVALQAERASLRDGGQAIVSAVQTTQEPAS